MNTAWDELLGVEEEAATSSVPTWNHADLTRELRTIEEELVELAQTGTRKTFLPLHDARLRLLRDARKGILQLLAESKVAHPRKRPRPEASRSELSTGVFALVQARSGEEADHRDGKIA